MAPVLQNIRGIWQRAGLAQQILLVAVVLGGIGAAVLLVNWARQPRMALLYARLDPEEAAKIVEKIRDADVPCELKAGGTSIYVPEDKVYSLRLDMASEGLTTGGQGGYGILDSETIGTSPFKQSVNYVRAIEGELRATDVPCRYGGDEFAVVLPETDADEARRVAQRMLDTVRALPVRPPRGSEALRLSLSIGVATYPEDGETAGDLIASADSRLYLAKQSGRSQVAAETERPGSLAR